MYVAKFSRARARWKVTLFEKHWSETMLTNEIREIGSKRFFFYRTGKKWINKEIARILFEKHQLEII